MSADPDNKAPDYSAELENLESRLHGHADDEAMLVEVGGAIRSMLADSTENESHIQEMLQKQFDEGHLRKETYELVQNLLGKIVTEEMVRAPIPESASVGDELFAKTDVIDGQAQAQAEAQAAVQAEAEAQAQAEAKAQAKVDAEVQARAEAAAQARAASEADAQRLAQRAEQATARANTPVPTDSAAETTLQVGSLLRDRFLLKEKVSEGSMGVVYKALDKRLAEAGDAETNVAIKVLSPQLSRNGAALRALQQEAAKGRCLTHPNIVRFIDLDREGETYFIVMEWLEGRSLSSILDENPSSGLDLASATDIVRHIAGALDFAHKRGVVHADVKPGNVMITPTGQVKLIDFGIARVRQKDQEGKSRFDPAVMQAGTPAYSSMQVLTGENPVPADDVFSLACLLYRMIAGYRVFGPRNAAQAAEDGMEPQQPQGLPDAQWQALKKALSYSRVTRFESAAAFIKALGIKGDNGNALTAAPAPVAVPEPVPTVATPEPGPPVAVAKEPAPSIQDEHVFPAPARKETSSPVAVPITADKDPIMFDLDDEDERPRKSPWRLMVIGAIIVGSVAVVTMQTDLVDQIGETVETIDLSPVTDVFDEQPEIIDVPAVDEATQDIAEFVAEDSSAVTPEDAGIEPGAERAVDEGSADIQADLDEDQATRSEDLIADPEAELIPEYVPIDYSTLPPATLTLNLSSAAGVVSADLTVREDGDAPIIDIFREDATETQTFTISEAEFSGNQSPLQAGIYALENDGQVAFEAGQTRARLMLTMRSNPVRESDRDVVLQVQDAAEPGADLARINVTLEDDDQRAFESGLPRNTVAFAVNQVSVRESDSAVQIDVIRYNSDNTTLEVGYVLQDVTATEGQDYFTPGSTIIYFAAGQRTARILVPLGQDARPESDEAFLLELETPPVASDSNIFSQIAVMIRDDDS